MKLPKTHKHDKNVHVCVGQEWTDLEVDVKEAKVHDWLLVVLLALALLLLGIAAAFFVLTGNGAGIDGLSDFSKFLVLLLIYRQK